RGGSETSCRVPYPIAEVIQENRDKSGIAPSGGDVFARGGTGDSDGERKSNGERNYGKWREPRGTVHTGQSSKLDPANYRGGHSLADLVLQIHRRARVGLYLYESPRGTVGPYRIRRDGTRRIDFAFDPAIHLARSAARRRRNCRGYLEPLDAARHR